MTTKQQLEKAIENGNYPIVLKFKNGYTPIIIRKKYAKYRSIFAPKCYLRLLNDCLLLKNIKGVMRIYSMSYSNIKSIETGEKE